MLGGEEQVLLCDVASPSISWDCLPSDSPAVVEEEEQPILGFAGGFPEMRNRNPSGCGKCFQGP